MKKQTEKSIKINHITPYTKINFRESLKHNVIQIFNLINFQIFQFLIFYIILNFLYLRL